MHSNELLFRAARAEREARYHRNQGRIETIACVTFYFVAFVWIVDDRPIIGMLMLLIAGGVSFTAAFAFDRAHDHEQRAALLRDAARHLEDR